MDWFDIESLPVLKMDCFRFAAERCNTIEENAIPGSGNIGSAAKDFHPNQWVPQRRSNDSKKFHQSTPESPFTSKNIFLKFFSDRSVRYQLV